MKIRTHKIKQHLRSLNKTGNLHRTGYIALEAIELCLLFDMGFIDNFCNVTPRGFLFVRRNNG